jgi:mono/diheme cytochrome c family protein
MAAVVVASVRYATAGPYPYWYDASGWAPQGPVVHHGPPEAPVVHAGPPVYEIGGSWYWLRSADEEKRVVSALYNRYCLRCHGVDGRGVWDIPDVPNFANATWQACRSDGQIARIIIEGRGAIMPPFRGTFTVEEAWAMARYLRTFLPGSEKSRPDYPDEESKSKNDRRPRNRAKDRDR